MARPLRIHFNGAIYHAMARGIDGRRLFDSSEEYRIFLRMLKELQTELKFQLFAFCLMPNHFHLLIKVAAAPLERIMQRLTTRYAMAYNRRRRRMGHLFQGRYLPKICANDSYFRTLLRYVHMNPSAAGLVASPADWPWSGHKELTGEVPPFLISRDYPLSRLGHAADEQVGAYNDLLTGDLDLAAGVPEDPENPWWAFVDHELKIDLDEIAQQICDEFNVDVGQLLDGTRGAVSKARQAFVIKSAEAGASGQEIAAFLGVNRSSVSRALSAARNATMQRTTPNVAG